MQIAGTVAIVTGASRGIGARIARTLAARGAAVALAARSEEALERTASDIRSTGGRAVAVACDVTERSDLERLVAETESRLGPPDVLVNNAGIEHVVNFERIDLDLIESILKTNVIAAEILTRLVVPGMIARARGHIVNMSSLSGKTAYPYNAVYSSSKHALVGFSWSLREELKPHRIGVSVVCPSYVSDTGMYVDWSRHQTPKGGAGLVPPAAVVAAVIKAIEQDKAEIIVARGLARIVDVVHAISPRLATTAARRTGAYDWIAGEAAKHSPSP